MIDTIFEILTEEFPTVYKQFATGRVRTTTLINLSTSAEGAWLGSVWLRDGVLCYSCRNCGVHYRVDLGHPESLSGLNTAISAVMSKVAARG